MYDEELEKIELSKETIRAINHIQEHYWFGMFQKIKLAPNAEVEYILRNALDDFKSQTKQSENSLFSPF